MLEIVLKNYIELIQLADAFKKVSIHQEMRKVYDFSQETPPFCLEKYQRYFKLQRIFEKQDQDICNELKISLLNDAHLIQQSIPNVTYRENNQNLSEGFEELRQKQNQKKLELIDKIESIIKNDKSTFFQQKIISHSSNVTKTQRSLSASRKQQPQQNSTSGGKNTGSSLKRSSSHKKIGNNSQYSQLGLISNQENIEQQQQQYSSSAQKNYQTMNSNISMMSGGQSRKMYNSTSNINQKIQPNQLTSQSFYSTSRINSSLNTMNKFTKLPEFANHPSNCLKLRNSDKDTLIVQLSESLNQKISEQVRLEEINQRLRVEINDQCKQADKYNQDLQNQISYKEDQIKHCQEQIEAMNQNLSATKQKMNVLLFQNYEIEKHKNNYDKAQQVIERYNTAFKYQELLDEKESYARDYYNKSILQFGFNCLQFAVNKNKRINSFKYNKQQQFLNNQGYLIFQKWFSFTQQQKRIKQAKQIKNRTITSNFLIQWKNNVIFLKNLRIFNFRQNQRMQLEYYCQIKQNYQMSKRLNQEQQQAIKHYNKRIKNIGFKSIKLYFEKYNLNKKDEAIQSRKAIMHYNQFKKRYILQKLMDYQLNYVIPMKEKKKLSKNNFNLNIIKKSFYRWTMLRNIKLQNEQKAEIAQIRKQKKFLQKLLWRWRDDYHYLHVKKQSFNNKIDFKLKLKYFQLLSQAKIQRQNKIQSQQIIQNKINRKIILKTIKSLKINISNNKKLQKRIVQFQQQKQSFILNKIFKCLKKITQEQQIISKRIKLIQLKITQKFFGIIQKKAKRQINRKEKNKALIHQAQFKLQQNYLNAFKFWKSLFLRNQRNSRILATLSHKRKQKILHQLIIGLQEEKLRFWKRRSMEQYQMLQSQEQRCNENIRYANEADTKQIDYINKLDILSQNIDFLKSEISEKDIFIANLKDNISAKNQQIEDLQSELMIAQTENKDILKKLSHLDNQLINQVSHYETTLADHQNNFNTLSAELYQAQSDFQTKERGYKEQIGGLNIKIASQDNYISKLESIKSDLEEKYTQVETYSTNQKKENQDLLSIVSNFDEEREQYKNKIEECLRIIEENSQMYEQKIIELKEQKNQFDTDNIVLLEKNHRQENEIIDLKNDLRKLEYQVEFMVAEQHKQTIQFIDNLNSNNNKHPINIHSSTQRHNRMSINPSSPSNQQEQQQFDDIQNINISQNDDNDIIHQKQTLFNQQYPSTSTYSVQRTYPSINNNYNVNQNHHTISEQQYNHFSNQLLNHSNDLQQLYPSSNHYSSPTNEQKNENNQHRLRSPPQQQQQQQVQAGYQSVRNGFDERQLQQKVVSIQEFLRPKRQDVSPLKSYLTSRQKRSLERKENQEQQQQQHIYILPSTNNNNNNNIISNNPRSNHISITSPSNFLTQYDTPYNQTNQLKFTSPNNYQITSKNSVGSIGGGYQKYESNNTTTQGVDSIQNEVRSMKANTQALKQNIERRLQSLNQNLDTDMINIKDQRLNSHPSSSQQQQQQQQSNYPFY